MSPGTRERKGRSTGSRRRPRAKRVDHTGCKGAAATQVTNVRQPPSAARLHQCGSASCSLRLERRHHAGGRGPPRFDAAKHRDIYATQGGEKVTGVPVASPSLLVTGRGSPSFERRHHLSPAAQLPRCGPAAGTVELHYPRDEGGRHVTLLLVEPTHCAGSVRAQPIPPMYLSCCGAHGVCPRPYHPGSYHPGVPSLGSSGDSPAETWPLDVFRTLQCGSILDSSCP